MRCFVLIFFISLISDAAIAARNFISSRYCEGTFGYRTRREDADRMIRPDRLKHSERFLKPFTELFKFVERKEYPISISDDFSHYRVVVESSISRNNVLTRFISFENRVLLPRELAALAKSGLIEGAPALNIDQYVAIDNQAYAPDAYTSLLQLLRANRSLEPMQKAASALEAVGKTRLYQGANAGLNFYLGQIARRSWPEKMKSDLPIEFWQTLPYSVFSVSTLIDTGEVVGTLQTIRAPYGVRTLSLGALGENMLHSSVGDWGPSYRKLAYLHPEEMAASDLELFIYDQQNLKLPKDQRSVWFHFIPPVERKMLKSGLEIQREIFTELWSDEYQDPSGKTYFLHWGAGELDEHARFAIRRDLNQKLFAEVYLQLFANAIDRDFSDQYNLLYRSYWTYNDIPELYAWAGYQPTGQTLRVHGKDFSVLAASGFEHVRALLNFSHATSPLDAEFLRQVEEMFRRYGDERYHMRGVTF